MLAVAAWKLTDKNVITASSNIALTTTDRLMYKISLINCLKHGQFGFVINIPVVYWRPVDCCSML